MLDKNIIDKPWLEKDGSTKSDTEIKEICINWTVSQWEEYLSQFEVEQKEILLSGNQELEKLSDDDYAKLYLAKLNQDEFPHLERSTAVALKQLTRRERDVLELLYTESRSERKVGIELGISRRSVRVLKTRALAKIRNALQTGGLSRIQTEAVAHCRPLSPKNHYR